MQETTLPTLLQIRLLVGFLGERAQCGWWPTAFFEPSGRLFLEPVFAITKGLAQYHGVCEAARRLHDEHLNVGSYHLFRLPEEVEQDLHGLVLSTTADGPANADLQNQSVALDALCRLGAPEAPASVGPANVGSITALDKLITLKSIAGAYASAFSQGTKTYPYLVQATE